MFFSALLSLVAVSVGGGFWAQTRHLSDLFRTLVADTRELPLLAMAARGVVLAARTHVIGRHFVQVSGSVVVVVLHGSRPSRRLTCSHYVHGSDEA